MEILQELLWHVNTLLNSMPGAIAQGLIWGIMAIGVYITFKILDVADLTVDGSIATGGAVCAMLMLKGHSVAFSLLVATVAGILAGLITGILHTFMGIPAILSGILTQLALYSVNYLVLGGANVSLVSISGKTLVAQKRVLSMPIYSNTLLIVSLFAIVIICVLYWFFGTELGCSLRATGCNGNMSRAQGINTNFNKILGLMFSNGIVALSGGLLAQFQGNADINMGKGAIVIGLAAIVIGEAIIGKHFNNFAVHLLGVVFGGIMYFIIYTIALHFIDKTELLKMLSAIIVALFLAIPYWKSHYGKTNVKKTEGGKQNA